MENRNKYITITIIVALVLAVVFAALYFSGFLTKGNHPKAVPNTQLTEQQKMDILSQVSTTTTPINTPPAQKQEILNNMQPNTKPTTNLTNEERLKILNQAQ